MFEKLGIKHGRMKGRMIREIHLASGIPFWTGNDLIDKAEEFAVEKYNSVTAWILNQDNREDYLQYFVNAFVLAYTDATVMVSTNVPGPKIDIYETPPVHEVD